MARTLARLYPDDWQTKSLPRLLGSSAVNEAIVGAAPLELLEKLADSGLGRFKSRRSKALLYK